MTSFISFSFFRSLYLFTKRDVSNWIVGILIDDLLEEESFDELLVVVELFSLELFLQTLLHIVDTN